MYRIPLEVFARGDKSAVYEETLEDLGRPNAQPMLPFNAYGTMAIARSEFEPNSGSSQVSWDMPALDLARDLCHSDSSGNRVMVEMGDLYARF